jgi:uncharacterized protein
VAEPDPHLPYAAPIEAYGNGGFRFGGMSHRGSLLCLPSGIWACPVVAPQDIDAPALARVFADPSGIDHFLIGTGVDIAAVSSDIRQQFRDRRIVLEVMSSRAAVRTYNILLEERRRVAALLIAVA